MWDESGIHCDDGDVYAKLHNHYYGEYKGLFLL